MWLLTAIIIELFVMLFIADLLIKALQKEIKDLNAKLANYYQMKELRDHFKDSRPMTEWEKEVSHKFLMDQYDK